MANTTDKYLSRRRQEIDPLGAAHWNGEDVLNPDWIDPGTQDWGDSSIASIGNHSLRASSGMGGLLNRSDIGVTSYSKDPEGKLHQYGVDSLERGQGLVSKYGGKLVKGYQGGEEESRTEDNYHNGVDSQGWGYFWVPPGETYQKQRAVTNQLGLTKEPTGLSALSDDAMAMFMLALAGGAVYGLGGVGATEAASAGAGATEAGSVGLSHGLEGELLHASHIGAEEAGLAGLTGGAESVSPHELAHTEQVVTESALPPSAPSNSGTPPTETPKSPISPSNVTSTISKILPKLLQSGTQGTSSTNGLSGYPTGVGGTGNMSIYGSSGPTNQATQVGALAQQQSPQTQQIAALLLQNPGQQYNPLAYQADENPMLARIAKQLQQEDDSYYG